MFDDGPNARRSNRNLLDYDKAGSTHGRPGESPAIVLDISEGGLGVRVHTKFKVGQLVELHVVLLRSRVGLRIDGTARVAHVRPVEPEGYAVGLQFVQVGHTRLQEPTDGARQPAMTDFGVGQITPLG